MRCNQNSLDWDTYLLLRSAKRGNEATIQSFRETAVDCRSNPGKAVIASARRDGHRFTLESYPTNDRGSAAELFHRPHASAYSDSAEGDEINQKDTCWLLRDRTNRGLFRRTSAEQACAGERCFSRRAPLKEVALLSKLHGAVEWSICHRIVFLERRSCPWRERHHAEQRAGPDCPSGNETCPA